MMFVGEYRASAERLADHLPWAALVAPGVVLNKDGSFLRVLAFRGPDLESATEPELVAACARANNALRRFGSGWALFFDAERREALAYPDSEFPDAASWLVDNERRAAFEAEGRHFESRYHLTLTWLPPADATDRAGRSLIERPDADKKRDWRGALASFVAETDRVLDLLGGFMADVRALDDDETLTFLHGTISDRRHRVVAPETPMYLDAILADTPLVGGLEPKLGKLHVRTLTILGFPSLSRPGILDALNHQDFGYRWVTRFIALDKTLATKTLTSLRRQWFNKRKSITALLREVLYNSPAQLLDSDADNKVVDADLALQALGGDHVAFGYLTTTITVADQGQSAVEGKVRAVERIVNGLGFTCVREGVNAVEAWLSSVPGHVYANVRQPLVHTLNLAHLMPLSSVWAGPVGNRHLGGPPLLLAKTAGSTPFRLSTHVGDVGHMMVVGPTGAGKSVLLGLIALQFRRYLDPVLMRRDWLEAYDFATRRGAQFLGEYARSAAPFANVGERTVSVQVTSVVRASDKSFQVKWSETAYERGSEAGTSRWTAILTTVIRPPTSAEILRKNPLGIYVDAIDWSRELDTTPPVGRPGSPPPANLPLGSPLDLNLASQPANTQETQP